MRSFPSRSHLLALALLLLPLLTGCFGIKIRELKTQNQMKEARIMQLQQDLAAVRDENTGLKEQLAQKESALQTTSTKAAAASLALQESTESKTKELVKSIGTSLESETKLKNQIENLEIKIGQLETRVADEAIKAEGLQKQLNEKNAALDASQKSLGEAQAKLDIEARRAEELSRGSGTQAKQLTETNAKLTALESELRQAKDELAAKEKARAELETQLTAAAKQTAESKTSAPTTSSSAQASPEAVGKALASAQEKLAEPLSRQAAKIAADGSSLRISFYTDDLFQPTTTNLSDAGLRSLMACAEAIKAVPYKRIVVEGHTDNTPVVSMPYPDNWELAAARANEVVRWLAAQPGLPPRDFTAQSRAFYAPVADNQQPAGRKLNRRVDVVLELQAN